MKTIFIVARCIAPLVVAVLVLARCSTPLSAIAADAIIPISFSLESYGYSQGAAIFSIDKTRFYARGGGAGGGRGFNVAVINLTNYTIEDTKNFDTYANRLSGGAHTAFVDYLNSIPSGKLVMVAVGDEAGLTQYGAGVLRCQKLPYPWVDAVIGALQNYGSTNIGNYCYNDAWGMIFIKGQTTPLVERLSSAETFPNWVQMYALFAKTVPRPIMSISTQEGGGGQAIYTLTVTNVIPSRDIEIQYTDALQQSWQHLRTLNNPLTNVVQTSDVIMFSSTRFFKAIMDSSVQLPPGF